MSNQLNLIIIDDIDWLKNRLPSETDLQIDLVKPSPSDFSTDTFFFNTILNSISRKQNIIFLINVNLKLPNGWRQSQSGVDVLKHIRYTTDEDKYPEYVRFAPVILYSFESDRELLQRKSNSLIIQSPGIAFLRIPEGLGKLQDKDFFNSILRIKRVKSPQELVPFLFADLPDKGESLYDHSYRNIAGAPKFIKEFSDSSVVSDLDPVFEEYNNLKLRDLAFKQIALAHDEILSGSRPNLADWSDFRHKTASMRVLYVDDQHKEGWGLGLYAGLRGKKPINSEFDENFTVVDSFDAANQTLEAKENEFTDALNRLDSCKQTLVDCEADIAEKEDEAKVLKDKISVAEKTFEAIKDQSLISEQALIKSQTNLVSSINTLGESYITLEEQFTRSAPRSIGELEVVAKKIDDFNPALNSYFNARKAFEEDFERLAAAQTSLTELQNELQEFGVKFDQSKRMRDISKIELSRIEGAINNFPTFDVAFIDLRLEPVKDKGRLLENISGFTLLKKIKEFCPALPIIVMTASQKAITLKAIRRAGFDAYWIKGRDSGSELKVMIQSALTKRDLIKQWKNLRLLTNKTTMMCKEATGSTLDPRGDYIVQYIDKPLTKMDDDRKTIERNLEQCLWSFYRYDSSNAINKNESLGNVIVNLGLVQELRFWNGKEQRSPLDRSKRLDWTRGQSTNETWFKRVRNEYVHEGKLVNAPYADLYGYFKHTVKELLG
jgi:CheY-like chemotaxis protein